MNENDAAGSGRIVHFLEFVKGKQPVRDFLTEFRSLFPYIHEVGLTKSYRLAKKPLKKVRDESAVLSHFLYCEDHFDFIQQNLGSGIPDAWLWAFDRRIDVEITVALAQMRLILAERLNNLGESPGFLPLSNDLSLEELRIASDKPSSGYSTPDYIETLYAGVMPRIAKKSKSDRSGILLVDCPISQQYVSAHIVDQLIDRVRPNLPDSGFEKIYLVDEGRVARLK